MSVSRFLILSGLALALAGCATDHNSVAPNASAAQAAATTAAAPKPATAAAVVATPAPVPAPTVAAPAKSAAPIAASTATAPAAPAALVDFNQTIKPIFATYCYKCHGPERQTNRIRFDSKANVASHGGFITPGAPNRSEIYIAMTAPDGHMPPPDQPQPTANDIAMMKLWITQGGVWPDESKP